MNMLKTAFVVGLLVLVVCLWSFLGRNPVRGVRAEKSKLVDVLQTLEDICRRIDRADFAGLSQDSVPSLASLDELDGELTTDLEHEALGKIRMACILQRCNIAGVTRQGFGIRNVRNNNSTVWKYLQEAKGRLPSSSSSLLAGRQEVPPEFIDRLPWITPMP